ncbi:MAG TPA: hypothetical protein VFU99_03175 [Gaiellaceae bacterium]|nr:hypothetical protein [Gaiellaceae bacterium]
MSGTRTTVDKVETDAQKWERNRLAWNLPRGVPAASAKDAAKATNDRPRPRSATQGTAENG